jgi:hypothetical protein
MLPGVGGAVTGIGAGVPAVTAEIPPVPGDISGGFPFPTIRPDLAAIPTDLAPVAMNLAPVVAGLVALLVVLGTGRGLDGGGGSGVLRLGRGREPEGQCKEEAVARDAHGALQREMTGEWTPDRPAC